MKHPWVMAGIALVFLALFAWLAPRIYRALRAEWTAFGALLRSWFGEVRGPRLTAAQQQWLQGALLRPGAAPAVRRDCHGGHEGFAQPVGTLCLTGREAVFFFRKWGRLVARQIGPPLAIETSEGLLLDELVLTSAGELRIRFDLLAGQLESARDEARRLSPSSSAI